MEEKWRGGSITSELHILLKKLTHSQKIKIKIKIKIEKRFNWSCLVN